MSKRFPAVGRVTVKPRSEWDLECLWAWTARGNRVQLDSSYCASCEEFPTCTKIEAKMVKQLASAAGKLQLAGIKVGRKIQDLRR